MSGEGELKKRIVDFNFIVQQECNYSCRLDHKKFSKPDRTQEFVKMSDIAEAKKEFPKEEGHAIAETWIEEVYEWKKKWFGENKTE
jgi:hypothetical protein